MKADLARHLHGVKPQHERDLQSGAGWVELPWALARKYPNAGREWAWQWMFPATRSYVDRVTGQRRRFGTPSPPTCSRTKLLGKRDVSTTQIYTHVLNRGPGGVRSPAADRLLDL